YGRTNAWEIGDPRKAGHGQDILKQLPFHSARCQKTLVVGASKDQQGRGKHSAARKKQKLRLFFPVIKNIYRMSDAMEPILWFLLEGVWGDLFFPHKEKVPPRILCLFSFRICRSAVPQRHPYFL
ncbi:MAG: hypothetical protein AB1921_06340, partial [Thermodesulfobacteriota bacterium]